MTVRRTSPVLIGRDAELRQLEDAVAGRADRPLILVGGEAGVGKTRLVRELRARQLAAGATVAVGSCVELGADLLPYAPFVESLGRLVEDLGDRADTVLGGARNDLAGLIPGLLAGGEDGPVGAGSRGRLYEALRAVLDRAPDPFVLVVEDVHWADQSTLELLSYLARRLRHGHTLLVATYRTDELHRRHPLLPVLAELERTGRTSRLELARLVPIDVVRLVRAIRGDDLPGATLDAITRRSEGNPFLVEELLAAGADTTSPLPGTVRELLLARIASIETSTRRVLGIVAAAGRSADAELVEVAWGGPAEDLDGALREAIDRALLVVEPTGRRLTFRHALLAEAIDTDLLPGERVRLHETLARVLAERPDLASATVAGAAAELAHHLYEARDLPAALGAAVRAADAAVAVRAYAEARALYERALELFERVPDASARTGVDLAALLDRAAEASFHAGDPGRAVALGRLAVAEAEARDDPVRIGYLLVRLIEWTEEAGDIDAIPSLAERALALVPEEPASPERAFAMLGAASARIHHGRNRELIKVAGEAARIAEACGAAGYEAIARSMRGGGLVGLARDAEGFEELERAHALASASGGTEEIVIVHANRVANYGYSGHLDRLGPPLAEARQAVDREGALVLSEPFFDFWEAALRLRDGRWPDAEEILSRHIERDGAGPTVRADLLAIRGIARVRRGVIEEGEADLHAALGLRPTVHPVSVAAAFGFLAEAALARGDGIAAAGLVEDALATLEETDEVMWKTFTYAVGLRVAADVAERSQARRERSVAESADRALERYVTAVRAALDGRLVEASGVNSYVRAMGAWGLAEASRARAVPDPDAWSAAASLLLVVGQSHLVAYCRYREAEAALAGSGNRARATDALRAAREWAVKVGADPLLRDVDALARRARLDLIGPAAATGPPDASPEPLPVDPYGLSPRERDVLALLVDGRTNREIGAALFISEKTASVHVSHILDKMGVTSRGAAAALAARAGLLDAPGR